ncbi:MAG TPA: phosphatidylserine decarboxylase [Fibrobacteres bacterium]|jgi:phosphatidylserine decarboxylase|nr:phosphatidylserine decarboxylase [Fibrobacterota bacterium]
MYSLLYLVPKNWLSRFVGWSVRRRWPLGLHTSIRDKFIRHFKVDASEAEYPLAQYPTLGEFFIRRLKTDARLLDSAALASPVDGALTRRGRFGNGDANPSLTQIKGIQYALKDFCGDGWDTTPYAGGAFLTLYLAPFNYHRIHAPADSRILRARHIAGALWPVNAWSVENIRDLFVRNDRILVEMESEGGRILLGMVGATNVGRITVSFTNELMGNSNSSGIRDWVPSGELQVSKGQDIGCFEMGSTVVLVLDAYWAERTRQDLLQGHESLPVRMGMGLSL